MPFRTTTPNIGEAIQWTITWCRKSDPRKAFSKQTVRQLLHLSRISSSKRHGVAHSLTCMHNIPMTSMRCLAMLRLCLDFHGRTQASMVTVVCPMDREDKDHHHEECLRMVCSDRHPNLTGQDNNIILIHDNRHQLKEDTPMILRTQSPQ